MQLVVLWILLVGDTNNRNHSGEELSVSLVSTKDTTTSAIVRVKFAVYVY